MQTITSEELIANAKQAYLEGRLTAQLPGKQAICLYLLKTDDGKTCNCAIGASFTPATHTLIDESFANAKRVKYLQELNIVEFTDIEFADKLQHAHDDWVDMVYTGKDSTFRKGDFLKLIGVNNA